MEVHPLAVVELPALLQLMLLSEAWLLCQAVMPLLPMHLLHQLQP